MGAGRVRRVGVPTTVQACIHIGCSERNMHALPVFTTTTLAALGYSAHARVRAPPHGHSLACLVPEAQEVDSSTLGTLQAQLAAPRAQARPNCCFYICSGSHTRLWMRAYAGSSARERGWGQGRGAAAAAARIHTLLLDLHDLAALLTSPKQPGITHFQKSRRLRRGRAVYSTVQQVRGSCIPGLRLPVPPVLLPRPLQPACVCRLSSHQTTATGDGDVIERLHRPRSSHGTCSPFACAASVTRSTAQAVLHARLSRVADSSWPLFIQYVALNTPRWAPDDLRALQALRWQQ